MISKGNARNHCPSRRIKLDKLSRVLVKVALDYVIRRFNASSARVLKSPWGWTFAGTPLSAICTSN
jgi:hypothetical protein